jgi:hypothetical protein
MPCIHIYYRYCNPEPLDAPELNDLSDGWVWSSTDNLSPYTHLPKHDMFCGDQDHACQAYATLTTYWQRLVELHVVEEFVMTSV